MKKGDLFILLWRIPLDFAAVIAAWFLAYHIRPYTDLIPWIQRAFPLESLPLISFFIPFTLFCATGFVVLMGFLGRYQFSQRFEPIRELFRLGFTIFLWGMLIVAWYAFYRHELIFSRIMLFHAMIFSLIFTFCIRFLLRGIQVLNWLSKRNRRKIILFGSAENTAVMKRALEEYPQFEIIEIFFERNINLLERKKILADELWRCDANASQGINEKLQKICYEKHLLFRYVPQESTVSFARLELSLIDDIPIVLTLPSVPTYWQRVLKRSLDLCASLFGLLLLSPIFLIFGILIKTDSKGPVFFKSTRSGRHGKSFQMWKFRSMVANAEAQKKKLKTKSHRDGPLFKVKDDPRVTKFGKFLRRSSLDELPNLINVLKGDMSLIGSRPHLPEEVKNYEKWQKRILMMKPGITGLAQTSGRSDLPFADEVRLDLYYLENWSFWLDIKILFKTILVVLSQKGAD